MACLVVHVGYNSVTAGGCTHHLVEKRGAKKADAIEVGDAVAKRIKEIACLSKPSQGNALVGCTNRFGHDRCDGLGHETNAFELDRFLTIRRDNRIPYQLGDCMGLGVNGEVFECDDVQFVGDRHVSYEEQSACRVSLGQQRTYRSLAVRTVGHSRPNRWALTMALGSAYRRSADPGEMEARITQSIQIEGPICRRFMYRVDVDGIAAVEIRDGAGRANQSVKAASSHSAAPVV